MYKLFLRRTFYLLCNILLATILAACAVPSIGPDDISFKNESHLKLPADARLAISMSSQELNKKYTIANPYIYSQLDEGRRVQNAAMNVFGKLFQQALPIEQCPNPHLVAKISSSSYISNLPTFAANATVFLYYGNGVFIGKFNGRDTTMGIMANDAVALENAYVNSFQKIANQILTNKLLIRHFTHGFTDAQTAKGSQAVLEKNSDVKKSESFPSKLDPFLDSVVVISTSNGIGSGFLVSSDGYLMTNYHVVGNDSSASVKLRDGRILLGSVEKLNRDKDLALIKIIGSKFPWLVLSQLRDSAIGTEVLAIGTPAGLEWSVSRGIISAIRKVGGRVLIQTDAAINKGNSGGPLISLKTGQVVGVNTLAVRKDMAEGLNFAVSSQDILESFPRLKAR